MDQPYLEIGLFVIGCIVGWLVAWLFYRKHKKHIQQLEAAIKAAPEEILALLRAQGVVIPQQAENVARIGISEWVGVSLSGLVNNPIYKAQQSDKK